MNGPTPNPPREDTHAFVVRLRRERPLVPDPSEPAVAAGRLHIRIEHVNTRDASQHDTMEGALGWLRRRMAAVLGPPLGPDDPAGLP